MEAGLVVSGPLLLFAGAELSAAAEARPRRDEDLRTELGVDREGELESLVELLKIFFKDDIRPVGRRSYTISLGLVV